MQGFQIELTTCNYLFMYMNQLKKLNSCGIFLTWTFSSENLFTLFFRKRFVYAYQHEFSIKLFFMSIYDSPCLVLDEQLPYRDLVFLSWTQLRQKLLHILIFPSFMGVWTWGAKRSLAPPPPFFCKFKITIILFCLSRDLISLPPLSICFQHHCVFNTHTNTCKFTLHIHYTSIVIQLL